VVENVNMAPAGFSGRDKKKNDKKVVEVQPEEGKE